LEHDFVGLSRGTALDIQLTEQSAKLNRPMRLRVQVRSYDAVCKLVAVGVGVSVVPEAVPKGSSLPLATIPLSDVWTERRLVAAVRSSAELTSVARQFYLNLAQTQGTN